MRTFLLLGCVSILELEFLLSRVSKPPVKASQGGLVTGVPVLSLGLPHGWGRGAAPNLCFIYVTILFKIITRMKLLLSNYF